VIVTGVVVVTCAHPADAGIVYVTVYVPAVLRSGRIAPVGPSMDRPAVDEKIPPGVPDNVTA
jgi:hypothetical protein